MRRRHALIAIGLATIACVVGAATAAQQVRDGAKPAPSGTGAIAGHVVVAGPGALAARRARVSLNDTERVIPGQTTTTDDTGAFAFLNLPPGRYEVSVVKSGYLKASYGASRPERAGTPIVLSAGQRIADLAITIARSGVITGAVRDARGRPLAGISVRVLKTGFNGLTGERSLATFSSVTTDDRGEYRAYGLPAGNYLVLANPSTGNRSGGPGVDDIRILTSVELQQALRAARGNSPGDPPVPLPPAPPATAPRVAYAPVFHPGVTDVMTATTIPLALSEERRGVDITMQYVPTATVSGTITDPSGTLPRPLRILLVPGPQTEMLAGAGLRGLYAEARADGSYTFGGVAPGAYTVKATSGSVVGRISATPPTGPGMWASADIVVAGRDLDVPLVLQRGVAINGRVEFDGAKPSPEELQTLRFLLAPSANGGETAGNPGGRVDADGRFTFADMTPDTYQFLMDWSAPGARGRWVLKSSVANGRDAFDGPLLVTPNAPVEWTLTFTSTPSILTGVFVDAGGRAATDYYIVVFPTDRKYWIPASRRVRTTRPATDGAFTVMGLPPGEYFLGAVTDVEQFEWNDPAFLEALVKTSATVTLLEGQTTRQDLRIGR